MKRQNLAVLTPKQERVAVLLAAGRTVREAAAQVRAGERTVFTWLRDDAFRAVIAAHRDEALAEAIGRLSASATAAADRLRALLDDEPPAIRLRAAQTLLGGLIRLREHGELATRLGVLELRLAETERVEPIEDRTRPVERS